MELANDVVAWGSVGLIMMLAEIIIRIIVFLGTSALTVAVTLHLGFIDNWVHAFILWFVLSMVLLITFRNVGQSLVGGNSRVDNTDEELEVFGREVDVVETIGPGTKTGRINFQGTQWSALGDGSEIKKGQVATIVCRENTSYVVERRTE